MLKMDGPMQILPMVRSFFDLQRNMSTLRGSVPPRPPMAISAVVKMVSVVTM